MNPIYNVLILVCIISSVGMGFHVRYNPALSRRSKCWYIAVYTLTAIAAATEFLGTILNLYPMGCGILLLVKVIEFSITPTLPGLMSYACGMEKTGKVILSVCAVHAAIEFVLLPFGKIIDVAQPGIYHRGEWYALYIVVYAISFIYLLWMFSVLSRQFQSRDLFTLFTALASVLCGVIPSVIHSSTRTSFLGITMTAILLYIYYEGLTEQDMLDDLSQKNKQIHNMQEKTIIGIADLIESRDSNTGTHVKNTSRYVEALAKDAMENGIYSETINESFVDMLVRAAPLHDVGKISVPDSILQKPGRLTKEEYEVMKRHAATGGKIIRDILEGVTDQAYIQMAYEVATYHHEKWDGTGYPNGLKGNQIPVSARIMAIADVYDALTMERVYKKAFPVETALAIIENDSGKHFDPTLGPLFVQMMRTEKTQL